MVTAPLASAVDVVITMGVEWSNVETVEPGTKPDEDIVTTM
jgi:hypothetical protein